MHRIAKGFFTGINYWGSKDAIHMWEHFDAAEIEKDFQVLRDAALPTCVCSLCGLYFSL